jgi:hypothetical protein
MYVVWGSLAQTVQDSQPHPLGASLAPAPHAEDEVQEDDDGCQRAAQHPWLPEPQLPGFPPPSPPPSSLFLAH